MFSEEEDKPGGPAVALISDRLWQRAFNRSKKIPRTGDNAARPELHRDRRHAAGDHFAAGQ